MTFFTSTFLGNRLSTPHITIRVFSENVGLPHSLQRTSESSAASTSPSTSWRTVKVFQNRGSASWTHTDRFANSNHRWFYRAFTEGWDGRTHLSASTYSNVVSAVPKTETGVTSSTGFSDPTDGGRILEDVGGGDRMDIARALSAAAPGSARVKTLLPGEPENSTSVTKTLRIPAHEFVPTDESQQWDVSVGYYRPGAAATILNIRAAIPLPKGVTVTATRFRGYRQNSTDSNVVGFNRVNDDGTNDTLAALTHSATTWETVDSSAMSVTVGDEGYFLVGTLTGVAAAADARLLWCEVDYTMSDFEDAY